MNNGLRAETEIRAQEAEERAGRPGLRVQATGSDPWLGRFLRAVLICLFILTAVLLPEGSETRQGETKHLMPFFLRGAWRGDAAARKALRLQDLRASGQSTNHQQILTPVYCRDSAGHSGFREDRQVHAL